MYSIFFSLLILMSSPQQENPLVGRAPAMAAANVIFASSNGGQSWYNISAGLPAKLNPISFLVYGDEFYLGAADGLYHGNGMLPVPSWRRSIFQHKDITGLYPGKTGLYAISLWNGFYQYKHTSGLWISMHDQLKDKNVLAVQEAANGDLYANCESGLYKSEDQGKKWEKVFDKGSVNHFVVKNDVVILSGSQGLWRSGDKGGNWERVRLDVTEPFYVGKLDGGYSAIFRGQEIAGTQMPNSVFRSYDGGKTWVPLSKSLPSALNNIYDIRQAGTLLFGCTYDGIFRSADEGKTWIQVMERPEGTGGFFKMTVSGNDLYALWIEGC